MAFDDLRSFLQALDDQGQLLKISEEVNAEPDLAGQRARPPVGGGPPMRPDASATVPRRCGSIIFAALTTLA